jgi:hypothetical protein
MSSVAGRAAVAIDIAYQVILAIQLQSPRIQNVVQYGKRSLTISG